MKKLIAALVLALATGLNANAESLKYHDKVVTDGRMWSVTGRQPASYCKELQYTLKLDKKHTFIHKCGETLNKLNGGK